jgi:hypothetical protein
VKNDTKATIRCLPLVQAADDAPAAVCLVCGKQAEQWGLFARSY